MNDSELLDRLDQRASTAVAALDAAVSNTPIPPVDVDGRQRPSRRAVVLAVAAVLAVLGLGAAAMSVMDDDEAPPVATSTEITHLVLPDPGALGYELMAAFDGSSQDPGSQWNDVAVQVQGPSTADDPWSESVLTYTLASADTTMNGEPVDIGGPEAMVDTSIGNPTVMWRDGDSVRFLVSARLDGEALVALAREVGRTGTAHGAVLPGHEVLYEGDVVDVFPVLAASIGAPQGVSGVAYRRSGVDEGFVLGARAGSDAQWRASYALAESVERVRVRGHDAVLATFDSMSMWEISWMEDDGTLVRVDGLIGAAGSSDDVLDDIVAVLDQLVAVDTEEFARLVRDNPSRDAGPMVEDISEVGSEIPSGDVLAQVDLTEGDRRFSARVVADDAGTLTLETSTEGPGESTSGFRELAPWESNVVTFVSADDGGGVVVAGLLAPDLVDVEVRERASGAPVPFDGPSTAAIEGSDRTLFLGLVGPGWSEDQLVAVGISSTGAEIGLGR